MQNIDLSTMPNSSGWAVIHDQDDNLYYIRSEKGHYLQGAFTSRRLAERRLYEYLVKSSETASKIRNNKK